MKPKKNHSRRFTSRGSLLRSMGAGIAFGLAMIRPAGAGETDPTLLITRAVATETANGTLLRLDAIFPWNALIQSGYPLELLVWQAAGPPTFVRFELGGQAHVGSTPEVADGLTPSEVSPVRLEGRPDGSHALTHVQEGRLEAVLGAGFSGIPLGAQLVVIDEGTPFVSNPVAVIRGLP